MWENYIDCIYVLADLYFSKDIIQIYVAPAKNTRFLLDTQKTMIDEAQLASTQYLQILFQQPPQIPRF